MKPTCYYLFFTCILMSISSLLLAQEDGDNLFNNEILHEIKINFNDADYWQTMLENYEEGAPDYDGNQIEGGIEYIPATITIDGSTYSEVGIRMKGFSSFWESDNKKSFKIDMNEFVDGQNHEGIKKMNLNNGAGDPAIQRDVIAHNLFRTQGIKAPRTAHTQLYINNELWGVYVIIEQVDKTFLKRNFVDGTGNLYKNMGISELDWEGDEASDYQPAMALKTNEEENDWTAFINFMDVLNNSSNADFPDAIQEVFNVDYYLRVLAIDIMLNNWDSYIEHGRNFYIYHEPVSGLFHWIPWDYNFSMEGGGEFGWGTNFPLILNDPNKTLIDRILDVPEFKEQYLNYVCEILNSNFTEERLFPRIDLTGELLEAAIIADPNYLFGPPAYNNDLEDLKGFISYRIPYLEDDLEDENYTCNLVPANLAYGEIVINEIMGRNIEATGISDPNGDYPDWIELYNNTSQDQWLYGYYLTDNSNELKKWAFPETAMIPANSTLIVWADNEQLESGLHAGFKLNSAGEELLLVYKDNTVIDAMEFNTQFNNLSYARIPNGTGDFTLTETITFDTNNDTPTSIEENALAGNTLQVYPNPARANEVLTVQLPSTQKAQAYLVNTLGQVVQKYALNEMQNNLLIPNVAAGIYTLKIETSEQQSTKSIVIH